MKPRLQLLLIATFAWTGWAAIDGVQGPTQQAYAQPPSGSSRSDSGSPDDRRDRYRGRSGDRGRGDWRSSRPRGEDKRGDDRSGSSSTPSTSSSDSSSSSRSTTSNSSTTGSSSTNSSTPSSSLTSSTPTATLQAWATKLVKEHDKNGNMILEPDEQGFLGSSAAAEDLNHDGKITIDELVMHHSAGGSVATAPASGSASPASGSSDSGNSGERDHFRGSGYGRRDGGSGADGHSKTDDAMAKRVLTGTAGGSGPTVKEGDKRHSYRFSRGTDKLPTGLPSWFKSRDTNGDGQVSLSEFSRTMSESTVAEFRRYDLNDDGIITAQEAAKQK